MSYNELLIKRNELLIDGTVLMNLEKVVPVERSHSQITTYCMTLFTLNVQNWR